MVALPDTHMPEAQIKSASKPVLIEETSSAPPLKRALMAGLGVASLMAALGVWIVPVDAGDTAMQLVKLVFSVSMLGLGMLFISALDNRNAEPEIHLDPKAGQLRIVEYDAKGIARVAGDYALKDLSDVSLRDCHLTARDADGNKIISVPLRNMAAETAIREALSITA